MTAVSNSVAVGIKGNRNEGEEEVEFAAEENTVELLLIKIRISVRISESDSDTLVEDIKMRSACWNMCCKLLLAILMCVGGCVCTFVFVFFFLLSIERVVVYSMYFLAAAMDSSRALSKLSTAS